MTCRGMRLVSSFTPLLLMVLTVCASQAFAQIYHVKDMNTEQIRALDRERTVVLLPGGILEQHGPYLPSFTDGYQNERLTQELANAVVERPGWQALVFPLIPLGAGGANEIGSKYSFSGTYAVRFSTLRAVFMDLATELGEQGFRWVFVVHLHGAPNHNRALDQAGEYFHDSYRGHMVNLTGLLPAREARAVAAQQLMSEAERRVHSASVTFSPRSSFRTRCTHDRIRRSLVSRPSSSRLIAWGPPHHRDRGPRALELVPKRMEVFHETHPGPATSSLGL